MDLATISPARRRWWQTIQGEAWQATGTVQRDGVPRGTTDLREACDSMCADYKPSCTRRNEQKPVMSPILRAAILPNRGGKSLAEREGFEPPIEFPLYTLSRRAPSTTRPSLRATDAPGGRRRPSSNCRACRRTGELRALTAERCRVSSTVLLYYQTTLTSVVRGRTPASFPPRAPPTPRKRPRRGDSSRGDSIPR